MSATPSCSSWGKARYPRSASSIILFRITSTSSTVGVAERSPLRLIDWELVPADARAHALGGFKATEFSEIQALSEIALHVARESEMHVQVSATR